MTRRRLITAKQAAAMTWEPWKETADMWVPPSNDVWCNPLAPVVRIAWRTMFLTKEELMGAAWWGEPSSKAEDEPLGLDAIERIQGALLDFEPSLAVLQGAQCRLLAAGSAVSLARGWEAPT